MSHANSTLGGRLEAWSGTLFLAGGILVVVYGGILGAELVTGTAYQEIGGFVAGVGGTLGFLGLLGLYSRYAEESPWLARVGALAALVGAVGFGALAVFTGGVLAGLLETSQSGGPDFVFLLVIVGMIPGFLLFAAAEFTTSDDQNRAALVLAAPAVVFAIIVGTGAAGLTQPWISAILGGLHGLSYVAIGLLLRTEVDATGTPDTAADSTV